MWDNTLTATTGSLVQCDVCLNYPSVDIINTVSPGLNEESHIGVYVTGDENDPTSIFSNYGKGGKHFGMMLGPFRPGLQ